MAALKIPALVAIACSLGGPLGAGVRFLRTFVPLGRQRSTSIKAASGIVPLSGDVAPSCSPWKDPKLLSSAGLAQDFP